MHLVQVIILTFIVRFLGLGAITVGSGQITILVKTKLVMFLSGPKKMTARLAQSDRASDSYMRASEGCEFDPRGGLVDFSHLSQT